MEEKRLLSKDEVYFLVFFLISLLDQSYCLAGITLIQYVHFIFAGEEPFPFTLFFLVFFVVFIIFKF